MDVGVERYNIVTTSKTLKTHGLARQLPLYPMAKLSRFSSLALWVFGPPGTNFTEHRRLKSGIRGLNPLSRVKKTTFSAVSENAFTPDGQMTDAEVLLRPPDHAMNLALPGHLALILG